MNEDLERLATGERDLIVLHDGRTMVTHGPEQCLGNNCCIHRPSEHPLNQAPLAWASDLRRMYRVCEHGSIHPDPDDTTFRLLLAYIGAISFLDLDSWHPCCDYFCCHKVGL